MATEALGATWGALGLYESMADAEKERDVELLAWLRANGFTWDPTQVDILRNSAALGGGRGVVALKRCEAGTVLARIPIQGCITRYTCSEQAKQLLAHLEKTRSATPGALR